MSKIILKKSVKKSPFWKNIEKMSAQLEKNRPKPDYPNLDKCEELVHKAVQKFGSARSFDYFPGDYKFGPQWRVWWTNHHVHPKDNPRRSSSSLSSHAPTLAEALKRVLNIHKTHTIHQGDCSQGCVGYSFD